MDFEICRLPDSEYHGCTQENFLLCGRNGILVRPQNPRKGNPWVWRAEFFDAFPSVDLLLLERGYHIAYYGLSDLYGAPQAINGMKLFYDYLTQKKALSARAELFGFSRGGMYGRQFCRALSRSRQHAVSRRAGAGYEILAGRLGQGLRRQNGMGNSAKPFTALRTKRLAPSRKTQLTAFRSFSNTVSLLRSFPATAIKPFPMKKTARA